MIQSIVCLISWIQKLLRHFYYTDIGPCVNRLIFCLSIVHRIECIINCVKNRQLSFKALSVKWTGVLLYFGGIFIFSCDKESIAHPLLTRCLHYRCLEGNPYIEEEKKKTSKHVIVGVSSFLHGDEVFKNSV